MMSTKNLKHLEKIKEAVSQSKAISSDEKSLAVKKIEEWYAEDKGMELLGEQLMKITKEIGPILEEMGLL
jgi:hypothetical protein